MSVVLPDSYLTHFCRYKSGSLIDLCIEHLGYRNPQQLAGCPERDRIKLQRFISGLRVHTIHTPGQTPRTIKRITPHSAQNTTFKPRDGPPMTVVVSDSVIAPEMPINDPGTSIAILPFGTSKES